MSRTRHMHLAVALLGAMMVLEGCDSSDPTSPDDAGTVTETGGALASSDGKVTLQIPAGAVTGNVKVTIAPVASPPASEGLVQSSAYRFGPAGITFSQPVEMAIQVPSGTMPADAPPVTAALHRLTGSQWVKVPGSRADASGRNVRGSVTSFSVYAVIFLGLPTEVVMGGERQSVPVGSEVPVRPSVVVRSSNGAPLEGLQITFAVTSGGGSADGVNQITDGEGRAAVGGWTVGSTAGPNTLTATIEGMSTPVVFEAQAVPGAPAAITFQAGEGQSAFPGQPLNQTPMVRVTDARGFPSPGATVNFSADRGGTVVQATRVTDAEGRASPGVWTLGDRPFTDPRVNTLTAEITGITPVTLTAGVLDPCTQSWPTAEFGTEVSGSIVPGRSCMGGARLVHRHAVDFPVLPAVRLSVHSGDFAPFLGSHERSSIRQLSGAGTSTVGGLEREVVFPPGAYLVTAGTPTQDPTNPTLGGSFTLSTGALAEPQVGCIPLTAVTSGSVAKGNITSADCEDTLDGEPLVDRRWDGYVILLQPGQTVTVTVSADIRFRTAHWLGGESLGYRGDVAAGGSHSFTHTAAAVSFHQFYVINELHQQTGGYTMTFSVTEASGNSARAAEAGVLLDMVDLFDRGGTRGH